MLNENNWWGMPLDKVWICPKCEVGTLGSEWQEGEVGCEDCGTHPGRECPKCGEWYDHVWGVEELIDAIEEA